MEWVGPIEVLKMEQVRVAGDQILEEGRGGRALDTGMGTTGQGSNIGISRDSNTKVGRSGKGTSIRIKQCNKHWIGQAWKHWRRSRWYPTSI